MYSGGYGGNGSGGGGGGVSSSSSSSSYGTGSNREVMKFVRTFGPKKTGGNDVAPQPQHSQQSPTAAAHSNTFSANDFAPLNNISTAPAPLTSGFTAPSRPAPSAAVPSALPSSSVAAPAAPAAPVFKAKVAKKASIFKKKGKPAKKRAKTDNSDLFDM